MGLDEKNLRITCMKFRGLAPRLISASWAFCLLRTMSSPEAQPKLDFKDNKTLRLIHEASLQDLLQARNYAALRLLEE